jgi:hypothetical protein
MPRCRVFALSFAFVLLVPALSRAAGEDCPDGWFCEPNAAPPAPAPSQLPPAPLPAPAPLPGPSSPAVEPVYDPAFYPAVADQEPPKQAPPKRRHRRFREWGFNVHLEGALLGDQPERDAAMGGLGFGFRYRVLPPLAFEVGVDLLRGAEHNEYWRSEAALLLNTLIFFNPRDVVQVYALGGLGFSRTSLNYARRSGDEVFYRRSDEHYSYFGGQLGLGVEVRVSRRVAIAGDLLGFLRGRTDDTRDHSADLVGANVHASDTADGGLLRVGLTIYW